MSRYTPWAERGLTSITPHADRQARRADLRARITAVLIRCGEDGITAGDLADELATRAKRNEVSAEVKRMAAAGLTIHEIRRESYGPRWYLKAGKAAA